MTVEVNLWQHEFDRLKLLGEPPGLEPGQEIRILLPGCGMWARYLGRTPSGQLVATLLNHATPELPWGAEVIVDPVTRHVVEPANVVNELAQEWYGCSWPEAQVLRVIGETMDRLRHRRSMDRCDRLLRKMGHPGVKRRCRRRTRDGEL